MRLIGSISVEQHARLFEDFLLVKGIGSSVEFDAAGSWSVWVHDEDRLEDAGDWLKSFNENPESAEFAAASREAESIRKKAAEELRKLEKRTFDANRLGRRFGEFSMGPVTITVMVICVVVYVISGFGDSTERIRSLFIAHYTTSATLISYLPGLPQIRSGEVWRLFTPMFIHFSPLHIFFNLYLFSFLGSMVESRQSRWYLILLMLVISGGSNFAQYVVSGPSFGGLSGVVYGLVGYVWTREKFSPLSGYVMSRQLLILSVIWLVAGVAGLAGNVANVVHAVGIFLGMTVGYFQSRFYRP